MRSANEKVMRLVGTFLICFSLLAFEVSTVRTISFAIGPSFIFISIALAMLGLTSAGSILSLVDLGSIRIRRESLLFVLCLSIATLLVVSNVMVFAIKESLNQSLRTAGQAGGILGILPVLLSKGTVAALGVGLFLALPYFLFGVLLSYLFATTSSEEYGRLYAADLLGAGLGCVAVIAAMETTSYAFSVTAPAIVAFLAAAAYAFPARRFLSASGIACALGLVLLSQASMYRTVTEPRPDPNYLVRDYEYESQVVESWSNWNSFSRVGAVEWVDGSTGHATLSLDNGDGMAYLWPYQTDREEPLVHPPTVPAQLLGPADDVLVMFAGVGADLMSLKEHGAKRAVGVELNATLVEAGLALPAYRLKDFLQSEGVRLEIQEGRAFLERDPSKYDVILLSWSGATVVYHLGALGGTTQHLFTYEGLSAIFDHLKEDGYAVILQVNKVNVLAALRRYMQERGMAEPERAAIVLQGPLVRGWKGNWDDNPLLVKLSGWSPEEVERITSSALDQGMETAYAPGRPAHPEYAVYKRILETPDIVRELAALREETGLRFDIVTDDRPFYLDLFENSRYLTADFWLQRKLTRISDRYHFLRVSLVLGVTIVAFLLALVPLRFRKGPASQSRATTFMLYFLALGAGFMFLEIGIIQRASLLFGNPGLTIAIVLCAVILFTGVGSLISNWSFARGFDFRSIAAAVAIYALILQFAMPSIVAAVIGWTLPEKVFVLLLLIAPGTVLMGHLFPQGVALARGEDKALVPWAWAINGAMSASIAGIGPLVAQAFGFGSLFLAAGVLYGCIVVLPLIPQPETQRDGRTPDSFRASSGIPLSAKRG